MPDRRITADEDESLECRALARFFEYPAHALDGDVHDLVGRLLAGG
jgi:hypothetical protein